MDNTLQYPKRDSNNERSRPKRFKPNSYRSNYHRSPPPSHYNGGGRFRSNYRSRNEDSRNRYEDDNRSRDSESPVRKVEENSTQQNIQKTSNTLYLLSRLPPLEGYKRDDSNKEKTLQVLNPFKLIEKGVFKIPEEPCSKLENNPYLNFPIKKRSTTILSS